MPRIPEETIQEILDRCDAQAEYGRYVALSRKGSKLWGLSPFKSEKTPSFTVDESSKLYYCFSTAQGGSLFTFLQKMENIGFMEAVRTLADRTGVKLPKERGRGSEQVAQPVQTIRTLLDKTSALFERFLWNPPTAGCSNNFYQKSKAAVEYMRGRGFTEQILKEFRVGYSHPDRRWLRGFLRKKGYGEQDLSAAGLFSSKYPQVCIFSDRIMFPIMSTDGAVVAFGGRLIEGDGPKYINSPQTDVFHKKRMLYGLTHSVQGIKEHKKVFVVEGYFDVLALHQAGVKAAVAPLGTAFTAEQAAVLRRMTDEAVIVFDNDEAGKTAAVKSAVAFESVGMPSIKIVRLSESDPADILQRHGAESVREGLLEQQEWFEYYIEGVRPSVYSTYQQKEQSIDELLRYLSVVKSGYKRAMYGARISEVFGIGESVVTDRVKILRQSDSNLGIARAPVAKSTACSDSRNDSSELFFDPKNTLEFLALVCVCRNPSALFARVRGFCKLNDLSDENARAVYIALEDAYRDNALTTAGVLERMSTPLAGYITKLIAGGQVPGDISSVEENLMYHIKLSRLKKYSSDIDTKIRKLSAHFVAAHNDDASGTVSYSKKLRTLLEEKQFYVQRIAELKQERKRRYETA